MTRRSLFASLFAAPLAAVLSAKVLSAARFYEGTRIPALQGNTEASGLIIGARAPNKALANAMLNARIDELMFSIRPVQWAAGRDADFCIARTSQGWPRVVGFAPRRLPLFAQDMYEGTRIPALQGNTEASGFRLAEFTDGSAH